MAIARRNGQDQILLAKPHAPDPPASEPQGLERQCHLKRAFLQPLGELSVREESKTERELRKTEKRRAQPLAKRNRRVPRRHAERHLSSHQSGSAAPFIQHSLKPLL